MTEIENILSDTAHRSFDFPSDRWVYYQEWNYALFLHWKVPYRELRAVVPQELTLDTFDGACYVSLVAFTMQKIRPRNLPALTFLSDFDEINLRTYVESNNKKGVYFLNIEAGKALSAYLAKTLSGLPYEKSKIQRTRHTYQSFNTKKNYSLEVKFDIQEPLPTKTELDKWLTERYCLYLKEGKDIYCYDIHHKEWEVKNVEIQQLKLHYKIGENYLIDKFPDVIHYSEGVKVIAWGKVKI